MKRIALLLSLILFVGAVMSPGLLSAAEFSGAAKPVDSGSVYEWMAEPVGAGAESTEICSNEYGDSGITGSSEIISHSGHRIDVDHSILLGDSANQIYPPYAVVYNDGVISFDAAAGEVTVLKDGVAELTGYRGDGTKVIVRIHGGQINFSEFELRYKAGESAALPDGIHAPYTLMYGQDRITIDESTGKLTALSAGYADFLGRDVFGNPAFGNVWIEEADDTETPEDTENPGDAEKPDDTEKSEDTETPQGIHDLNCIAGEQTYLPNLGILAPYVITSTNGAEYISISESTLTALAEGYAEFTAYNAAGTKILCRVTIEGRRITLPVEGKYQIDGLYKPVTIKYGQENITVAIKGKTGQSSQLIITGRRAGEAELTAATESGVLVTIKVTVEDNKKDQDKEDDTSGKEDDTSGKDDEDDTSDKILDKGYIAVKQKAAVVENPENYTGFTVDKAKLASIDQKGVLTAKAAGTVTVTATTADNETQKLTFTIEKPKFIKSTVTVPYIGAYYSLYDNLYFYKAVRYKEDGEWVDDEEQVIHVEPTSYEIVNTDVAAFEGDDAGAVSQNSTIVAKKKGSTKINVYYGEGKYAVKYTFTLKVTVPSISKKSATTKVGLLTKSALKLKLNMKGAGEGDEPEWGVRFSKEYDEDKEKEAAESLGFPAASVVAFERYEGDEETGKGADDAQSIRVIGMRPGTVYVTASIGGVEQGICKVTVSAPKLKKSISIRSGKKAKLSVTNIGTRADISWNSGTGDSDTASVGIDFSEAALENEDYRTAIITGGDEAGKCTVTVRINDIDGINGYTLSSTVTVK